MRSAQAVLLCHEPGVGSILEQGHCIHRLQVRVQQPRQRKEQITLVQEGGHRIPVHLTPEHGRLLQFNRIRQP